MKVKRQEIIQPDGEFRLIPLTQYKVTKVDASDFEFLSQWEWQATYTPSTKGWTAVRYAKTSTGKVGPIPMHRVIMSAPPGLDVDHRDHDSLNNVRSNLRVCTRSQNLANTRKRQNCTSQFKGVSFDPRRKLWALQISSGGKRVVMKRFDNELVAARAYDEAATRIFGEFANLNFPKIHSLITPGPSDSHAVCAES
jgi:hypothetical protein